MTARVSLESRLLLLAGSVLAGRGRGAALISLIFHRVLAEPDPLLPSEPDATRFAAQLELIARHFRVLPLAEAVARLDQGTLPSRAVVITFDDGYANNYTVALPLLKARGIPATVFVAPGFLNGGRMFNDTVIEAVRAAPRELDLCDLGLGRYELADDRARVLAAEQLIVKLKHLEPPERAAQVARLAERATRPLPRDLMMSDAQVIGLHRAGIEIGAHTLHHPILTSTDIDTARAEIAGSKAKLEGLLEAPVSSFAYPNGRPVRDYDRRHVELVAAAGFRVALSTAWGAATHDTDRLQLPRIAPWDASPRRYVLRALRAYRERRFATV